jgi:hypothetical protein
VFNSNPDAITYAYPGFAQVKFALHPAQAAGADPIVKTASFDQTHGSVTVPGLTTAVFVSE